uniref:Uncharacterized protein n=1 Tax=Panagrolaimus sp. PS1159 TaxID=55785 RepID=A0AC35FIY7_9BILA
MIKKNSALLPAAESLFFTPVFFHNLIKININKRSCDKLLAKKKELIVVFSGFNFFWQLYYFCCLLN